MNFTQLLTLISGAQGALYANAIAAISFGKIIGTAIYLLTMYIAAYALGKFLRWIIKRFKFDKNIKTLRLDSPWYYLFTGYDWDEGKPDGVIITAAVEFAGKGYLYMGYLDNFFLDAEGNIDRLVLTSAWRRPIENDKGKESENNPEDMDRFYSIDGHYFVLKYCEIKTLNVQFIKLEEKNSFNV